MKTSEKFTGYFHFTRKDRVAAIIIALILLTAFLLPSYLERRQPAQPPTAADTGWMAALRQLETMAPARQQQQYEQRKSNNDDGLYARDRTADKYNNDGGAELFSFNPNTLDKAGWMRLGVREKTIAIIERYLSKGGRFRKAEDLQKIYGLRREEYERLKSYVKLESDPAAHTVRPAKKEPSATPALATMGSIDINTADSIAFERLPGIGPILASRITRFREKLGGFYDIAQVSETFGISDSTFTTIRPYLSVSKDHPLQKIDINAADLNGLRKHPYIKYNVAAAIINYRTQHGPFTIPEKLKQLVVIDDVLYRKLIPYLNFR